MLYANYLIYFIFMWGVPFIFEYSTGEIAREKGEMRNFGECEVQFFVCHSLDNFLANDGLPLFVAWPSNNARRAIVTITKTHSM